MRKTHEFQMRLENGSYGVYMIRVNGSDIPRLAQRRVYATPYQPRAQVISDALNGGLLSRILGAMKAEPGESSTPSIT